MYVCMYPRTKLPKLSQPTHSDEETRERDQLMKFKSKQYADAARNARMSEVKQGDLVLMKQDKNKLSTTFEPQPYKVKEKKGNQVFMSDSDHPVRVLHRNTTEVKQYHPTDDQLSDTKANQEKNTTPASVEMDTEVESGSTDFQKDSPRRYLQRIRKPLDRLNL